MITILNKFTDVIRMDIDKDHSRPLFIHWKSEYPEIHQLVDELYNMFSREAFEATFGRSNNQGRCSPKQRIYIIIVDLYAAWLDDPKLSIGFSRDRNAYAPNSRYNEQSVPYSIVKVIDWLEHQGFIQTTLGNYDHHGYGRSYVSRMIATGKLRQKFEKLQNSIQQVEQNFERELIILKSKGDDDKQSKRIEYKDNEIIARMRDKLLAYNRLLDKTFIDIPFLDEPIATWANDNGELHRVRISQTDKVVRRIFNNNSWESGGRFHGGFWQRLKTDYRKSIWINDAPTIELDYSAMHPSILAAQEGICQPESFYNYGEGLIDEVHNPDHQRKIVKSLFLILFNAINKSIAFQAFRNQYSDGSLEKSLTNNQLERIVKTILKRHPYLEKHIFSDCGLKLMHIESQIAEKLMTAFTKKGIAILMVHESFIVNVVHAVTLSNDMKIASKEVLGSPLKFPDSDERLKLDFLAITDPEHYETTIERYNDRSLHKAGYYQRLKAFKDYQHIRS